MNCPAIAFTLRVSAKARLLNKRYTKHLERSEHKNIEDLCEDISCGKQLVAAQMEQTAQVPSGQCGREESTCELQREQCSS